MYNCYRGLIDCLYIYSLLCTGHCSSIYRQREESNERENSEKRLSLNAIDFTNKEEEFYDLCD
jgi:hypothetical protein